MKNDFKSESTLSVLFGTILIAIATIFWAFDHKIVFLIVTLLGVCAFIAAIYFHMTKPKLPEPRIDCAPDPFGRGQDD